MRYRRTPYRSTVTPNRPALAAARQISAKRDVVTRSNLLFYEALSVLVVHGGRHKLIPPPQAFSKPSLNAGEWLLAGLIVLIILAVALTVYLLPSVVAWRRRVRDRNSIYVLNVLFGWSLVGWGIAMMWALHRDPLEHYMREGLIGRLRVGIEIDSNAKPAAQVRGIKHGNE